ncbi:class I SAM-dependent methyltransferase [Brevundimonas sp.]|uniref:class I SAM-dependent methyltransferase n=1 Tax=Brevundimonas sp. TaxID=1871086 RepID=UPI0025BCB9E9|nr:class I SAM-dependent methyltransferase [Brevundimonas sp.]
MRHDDWRLVECECGAEMIWPIPDLSNAYREKNCFSDQGDGIAADWLRDPSPWRQQAADFQRDLRCNGIQDGETLMDVGCSHGLGPIEWSRIGYDAWGIDPNGDATSFIRAHGAQAWSGTVLDPDFPILSGVGAICSSHALEHMPDPYAALRKFWDLLRPGGLLILALPHWGSAKAQAERQDWKWWAPPWHIHYFRHTRLAEFLKGVGFEVRSVATIVSPDEEDEPLIRERLIENLAGETVIIWASKPH